MKGRVSHKYIDVRGIVEAVACAVINALRNVSEADCRRRVRSAVVMSARMQSPAALRRQCSRPVGAMGDVSG